MVVIICNYKILYIFPFNDFGNCHPNLCVILFIYFLHKFNIEFFNEFFIAYIFYVINPSKFILISIILVATVAIT